MGVVVVDDHLLRDILVGRRRPDLDGRAPQGVATTGLWLFRLSASLASPSVLGKLSRPLAGLPEHLREAFRARLVALPDEIGVISLRELAWPMAELQARHRAAGRGLSTAMTEALAAAHALNGELAVSKQDLGPALRSAARADGIPFWTL